MAKVLELPEQKVILRGISWETYERLLADNGDRPVPRLAYDRGALEVMSPSQEHEMLDRTIGLVVDLVADELGIDVIGAGHTTFKREDLQRGFEPDGCFWVRNEWRIRGKRKIDLVVDPPPDLVIEVDITPYSDRSADDASGAPLGSAFPPVRADETPGSGRSAAHAAGNRASERKRSL